MKTQFTHVLLCIFLFITWDIEAQNKHSILVDDIQREYARQKLSPLVASFQTYQKMKKTTPYQLNWVSLGPTLNSARADVVQVDTKHPGTMYVGFGSGGLWKTVNNGINWKCIFEEQASLGIGDMELAPSNPNIIYLGTGENLKKPRNFTLTGTGMYRSNDAGKTWQHIGLEDSWAIAEIAIHPKNPDIVMVAVLGHLWSKNNNRGLYQTINGGKTWQQVVYLDDKTGANDVVISPSNPKVMYASTWEVFPGITGKNSGVHRSTDGGKTWKACTKGLPSGEKVGRIGLSVSYTNPQKAYALVDNLNNQKGDAAELYKTTDGGLTWSKTHSSPFYNFSVIGWYFTDVYVNPKDDEEVYCLGVRLAYSTDGGKTFSFVGGNVTRATPSLANGFHLDQSELWINPENPNHLAAGNDGGFYVSYDKGLSWFHYNNIPTGEFYDLTIDQKNYLIYGGTQDDATVFGPAKEINPGFPDTWKYLWIDPWDGGDGCVSQVDPDDENTVYYSMQHGHAVRYNKKTDSAFVIQPKLPQASKDTLVFNYIAPYFISSHQSRTLYHGGNFIFKSTDRGDNWQVIGPNLAISSIKEKRSFSTVALVESKLEKGLLYAGTDKGAFWVSKNDGTSWEENSTGLANNYIRSICPSRFVKARVYVAMTGINYDDLQGYLYVSEDYGKNWKSIAVGLPNEPINVILEDPILENVLYLGGLRGVYISQDRGQSWAYFGANMPGAAIADLDIHEATMDLVAATHGRGIYRINLRPIHAMVTQNLTLSQDHLFEIPECNKPWPNSQGGQPDCRTLEKAEIAYWLSEDKSIKLMLKDNENKTIWSESLQGTKGFNQYRWDLIVSKQNSSMPYFIHYANFLKSGTYKMVLTDGKMDHVQPFILKDGVSPFNK
jgi:photosystem II stability/assembly factor-like uncharacterized protein